MTATITEAVALARERRFAEAAAAAVEYAGTLERRQPDSRWLYEAWGAAGKFFHLAGSAEAAMEAFDRCFAVFDRVLPGQTNVGFVMNHTSAWPELFARAALSALDAGQPARAVDYSEAGRARLVGSISRDVAPPSGADPSVWAEYRSAWRRLAWQLADRKHVEGKATREDREAADRVGALRRHLRGMGVPSELLSPVSEVATVADVVRALRNGDGATSVVYAISLDEDVLRPVLITSDGAREITLPPEDQKAILDGAYRFAEGLPRADTPSRIDALLQRLLDDAARPLAALLEEVLAWGSPSRVVWIPHGALVTVPLAAIPLGRGTLVDAAAIQVAPSLTMAERTLRPRTAATFRAAYVEGRAEGKTPTEGGEALLPPAVSKGVGTSRPASLDELRAAAGGCSLVLFSSHGVFDWERPVSSYLELGFDCTMDDLVGSSVFDDGTVVVMNTCDAGTVAQDVTNEPVGIPIALMASGAETVLGPSQPVAALAGVVFCLLVLEELDGGLASPEAVQSAVIRMRGMTRGEVAELLRSVGHPFGEILTSRLSQPAFRERAHWAFFQHWGGSWKMSRRTRDDPP